MYHKYEYIVSIRGLWGWGHPPLIVTSQFLCSVPSVALDPYFNSVVI